MMSGLKSRVFRREFPQVKIDPAGYRSLPHTVNVECGAIRQLACSSNLHHGAAEH
jgi:hypothetical protein